MRLSKEDFVDRLLSLLWGVWTAIGVPGWSSDDFRMDFLIDPEAFIIAAAHFGEHDVRLRDAVIDWCVSFFPAIPRGRLKNLLGEQPTRVQANFGPFAATVNSLSSARWPGASSPLKVEQRPTAHRDLRLPHLLTLRMRGLLGSSARAEVLTLYATNPHDWLAASQIASRVQYQKRSVADVLSGLAAAGLLESKREGNRLMFRLQDSARLLRFVGEVPDTAPRWAQIFLVLYEIESLLTRHDGPSPEAELDVVKALTNVEDSLKAADFRNPGDIAQRPGVWEPFINWVDDLTANLARGVVSDLPGVKGNSREASGRSRSARL